MRVTENVTHVIMSITISSISNGNTMKWHSFEFCLDEKDWSRLAVANLQNSKSFAINNLDIQMGYLVVSIINVFFRASTRHLI